MVFSAKVNRDANAEESGSTRVLTVVRLISSEFSCTRLVALLAISENRLKMMIPEKIRRAYGASASGPVQLLLNTLAKTNQYSPSRISGLSSAHAAPNIDSR